KEARYHRRMMADSLPLRLLRATPGWMGQLSPATGDRLLGGGEPRPSGAVEGRRVQLTDDQRRRLASKGERLGRRVLRQVATILTPDTILRWHRRLIGKITQ